jgi:hypothetical protein
MFLRPEHQPKAQPKPLQAAPQVKEAASEVQTCLHRHPLDRRMINAVARFAIDAGRMINFANISKYDKRKSIQW